MDRGIAFLLIDDADILLVQLFVHHKVLRKQFFQSVELFIQQNLKRLLNKVIDPMV